MSKKKSKKVAEAGEKVENNDHKEVKEQKQGGENVGGGGAPAADGGKKEGNGNAVLFKLDLHCEGCASKVVKIVKGFEGVETVKIDGASSKCAVTGKVDPVKLRDKLEEKTHKKVELLTPVPKKEKENTKSKDESGDAKEDKKKHKEKPKDKNSNEKNKKDDEKNAKQIPVASAMLKVPLHCEGCIQKIFRIVSKTKGYEEMKLDKPNDVVMVKGAMDMKALAETLKKHLKRDVQILQPKKDEKKEEKKEKEKEKKGKGSGEGNAAGSDGAGGEGAVQDVRETMEGSRMQVQQFNYGYGYPSPYMHAPSYAGGVVDPYYQFSYHAPQIFSDENPNACSIM